MGLDINLFRKEKGFDPEVVRESEKRRFRKPNEEDKKDTVDRVIEKDELWRKARFQMDQIAKELNALSKAIGDKKKNKEDCGNEINKVNELKEVREKLEKEEKEVHKELQKRLNVVGNLVHDSVVVSDNEDHNQIVRTWGTIPDLKVNSTPGFAHHHEILAMIDGFDPKRGSKIAGHRGFFLKGVGALLNLALISYGTKFLAERQFTLMHTPFFMKKSIMAETCQLSDFDDQLYKVSTGKESTEEDPDNEFYLIATSEQPLSAYYLNEVIDRTELPIRFGGVSTCFRKEAGAAGKDAWGIFRIHQFEKVEQFVITKPEDSWAEHERMIRISEEFYQSLELPYRVVSIVSGALNDAAAKKYDLEAWFPGYETYRELVSVSNCTDFQSRGLNIKMTHPKKEKDDKEDNKGKKDKDNKTDKNNEFVHMLNGTLCATERALCCILENYQTPEGVRVPKVLVPYVGTEFIKYTQPMPKKEK